MQIRLHSWYAEAVKATWRNPQDIKDQYARASIGGNDRVVFNVGGNKYRNGEDLRRAFRRLEKVFQAGEVTPQADGRDVLVTPIEACENKRSGFGPSDPVEAIKFRVRRRRGGAV